MAQKKKIKSVTELARYQTGEIVYWVVIRPNTIMPMLDSEDEWMIHHHPKELYTRGPAKKLWPYHKKLPRLHHSDFECIVNLLCSNITIETFHITNILRSKETGEFFYSNSDEEWMPESCLFDTDIAAKRESKRVQKMIYQWAENG